LRFTAIMIATPTRVIEVNLGQQPEVKIVLPCELRFVEIWNLRSFGIDAKQCQAKITTGIPTTAGRCSSDFRCHQSES